MTEKSSVGYPLFLVVAALCLIFMITFALYGIISLHTAPITGAGGSQQCDHGYVCGIKSDGCAVPGAIYNCPNEPVNSTPNNTSRNGTVAVTLFQEVNNSIAAGFNLSKSAFHANSSSECSLQLIGPCDNNIPSQFICINRQYNRTVSSQYGAIYTMHPRACPEFFMTGTVSCGLVNNSCVVISQKSSLGGFQT
jgi:hypothetical protein